MVLRMLALAGVMVACLSFTYACRDRSASPSPIPRTPFGTAASTSSASPTTTQAPVPSPTVVPSRTGGIVPLGWARCSAMLAPRSAHTATQLADGRVLVVGGSDVSEAETFDPDTGRWTSVPGPSGPRREHGAQRLWDGRVIVFGGLDAGARTDIFDPKTNSWSPGPELPPSFTPLSQSFALPDGRLLALGRPLVTQGPAQLFVLDAAATRWTRLGTVGDATLGDAVLLSDGTILATNVDRDSVSYVVYDYEHQSVVARGTLTSRVSLASLQGARAVSIAGDGSTAVFDAASRTWAKGPAMPNARSRPFLVSAGTGVLAIGARVPADAVAAAAVSGFDGASWTVLTPLNSGRQDEAVLTIRDGRVLVTGGRTGQQSLDICEIST